MHRTSKSGDFEEQGTFKHKPVEQIKLGLKEFEEEKKQTFWYLMKSPFINVNRIGSDELNKME